MATILTTAELLRQGAERLRGAESSGLDAEVLLAHVLGVARARVRSHPEESRTPEDQATYVALIERRARGEPLAYLVGQREFWSLELAVTPAVLVPRPETELVVERALALRPEPSVRAADLGTGSGAIALALARERPRWQLVATDVAGDALALAQRNAAALGIGNVAFRQGSWLAPLAGERFALIVSNPPYVSASDPVLAAAPLAYEPTGALTPGGDGLAALQEIIRAAPAHLTPGAWLVLEHGTGQGPEVASALVARGFGHVRSHRDLGGHERVTEARWG
jgi:release factor glutamine methyltransferase